MNGVLSLAISHVGSISLLFSRTVRETVRKRPEWPVILDQMHHLGVRSLAIGTVTALFTGMVLALQTSYSLAAYGAKLFVGRVVALSLVRELGPVLTALMVSGRVGSGITAELGSMTVTEQVDALRSMGISPVRRLVVPRVLATVIMLPILTAIADVIGILGGLGIAIIELRMTMQDYLTSIWNQLAISDIMSGLSKTF